MKVEIIEENLFEKKVDILITALDEFMRRENH